MLYTKQYEYRHVNFKDTMTKWPVQINHTQREQNSTKHTEQTFRKKLLFVFSLKKKLWETKHTILL